MGAIPIRQAADRSTLSYTDKTKDKPAIGLLSVVLAANREYNKVVEPHLRRIEKEEPELKTFEQLSESNYTAAFGGKELKKSVDNFQNSCIFWRLK